jgi:hypothetical protein
MTKPAENEIVILPEYDENIPSVISARQTDYLSQ